MAGLVYPPFEEVRPQLEQEAAEAAEAGGALVDGVRDDLGVTVNPRYGVLEEGELVAGPAGSWTSSSDGGEAAPADAGTPRN